MYKIKADKNELTQAFCGSTLFYMQLIQRVINKDNTLLPVKKLNWQNIIFMSATHLIALIGIPIYAFTVGISWGEIVLALFFFIACDMATTVGYHRMLSHRAFKGGNILEFLTLFFGAGAFEMSALDWSAQHRDHHRYVDTDRDPYSIKKGFFYAHMGWLLFWKHDFNHANCKDLQKRPMIVHQHKYYIFWAVFSGAIVPMFIGLWMGHLLGAFLLAFCARVLLGYQSTFCINSVCHVFGKAVYDLKISAKDHWVAALLTFGEGYHNFHHKFPGDYRNAVQWYQWDPTKWFIMVMRSLNLASDLHRTSKFKILSAKFAAQRIEAQKTLGILEKWKGYQDTVELLRAKHQELSSKLAIWETDFKVYKLKKKKESKELIRAAKAELKLAKRQFKASQREWKYMMKSLIYLPKVAPILT